MVCIRLVSSGSVIFMESGIILHSDIGSLDLEGKDVRAFVKEILPLLDGTREQEAIVNTMPEELRSSALIFLDLLERLGLLEVVNEDPLLTRWSGQQRFFRALTGKAVDAYRRLREARVLIAGLEPWGIVAAIELASSGIGTLCILDEGEVSSEDLLLVRMWREEMLGCPRKNALAELLSEIAPWCQVTTGSLSSLNIENTTILSDTPWNLVIGAIAPNNLSQHLELAHITHKAGLPSLFGTLQGFEALVGPLVIPGETACWNCCRLRLLANVEHPHTSHILQKALFARHTTAHSLTSLAPIPSLLGHLLALETIKLLSGCMPSQLQGRLLFQNMITLETTLHTIIPMPWCRVCGGARAMRRSEDQSLLFPIWNTPEDLQRSLVGWIDSRTGVISQLVQRKQELAEPYLPICATAFLSAHTDDVSNPLIPEMVGGKGLTAVEAMIGAVGEAIERYSASHIRLEDLHRSTLHDLSGNVFDPRWLCLYEDAQYNHSGFPFVRFDTHRSHLWVRGWWMDNEETVWIPALPTFFNFPHGADDPFCQVTSNGLAAGVSLEDAAPRAIYELVERDAFMLTWLCRRPGRRLIVDDALGTDIYNLLQKMQMCGADIELYLLDVGLSIPTVICLALGDGQRWPGLTIGLAAHMSPHIAARKAILEQGYSGLSLRRLMLRGNYPIFEHPKQIRTFLDHALFYIPAAHASACDFLRSGNLAPLSLATLQEPADVSLKAIASQVALAGIRIALVDVTAPDVALSPFRVVRSFGTYMQPIHCGFGLDRLENPRLRSLLNDEVNSDPHPCC